MKHQDWHGAAEEMYRALHWDPIPESGRLCESGGETSLVVVKQKRPEIGQAGQTRHPLMLELVVTCNQAIDMLCDAGEACRQLF